MITEAKLSSFNPNELKPEGWLLNQLRIQANGLSGNLHKIWPDVRDSKWIGGHAEGWERVPYWLDGFIPLAYLIDDRDLIADAKKYIDAILSRQKDDGWICPCEDSERSSYDVWAAFLIFKVLCVYADCSGDARIEDAVYRGLKNLFGHINSNPLFGWAQMRWFECLIPAFWLYRRRPEKWIEELILLLRCEGFDYKTFFAQWPYAKGVNYGEWCQTAHVVNNAMSVKAYGLYHRFSHDESDIATSREILSKLTEAHGTAAGAINGDECLSTNSPIQGSELCSVVELMYSLEQLTLSSGSAEYFDRLEQLAYNCLPAALTPDMWAHQYDQQSNQVMCVKTDRPIFTSNNGESNLFGLEPNFGCCTANFSQGWPKFALSQAAADFDGTVYILGYAPFSLNAAGIKLEVVSEYPFKTVGITLKAECRKDCKLMLRIPDYCKKPEINGKAVKTENGYAEIKAGAGITEFNINFPAKIEFTQRPNNFVSVYRRPLVYSLKIEEKQSVINRDVPGREFPHCDYEFRPMSDYNYALASKRFKLEEREVGLLPFSPNGAPVSLMLEVRKLDWRETDRGCIAKLPDINSVSPEKTVKEFIPYGCTNIRLTELPLLKDEDIG